MVAALVAVFVLSGAAGLVYESLWSRYLGLFVGHSAYAQIIVLVIFLGGMSLGAHLAGRFSQRIRSPLLWYAMVELVVGMLAIVFHDLFLATTAVAYDSIFPSLSGMGLLTTKWLIAGALILPQSVLLGATFPLMSAGVIRVAHAAETPGGILSLLYFSNSLGAAVGVLLAGLWLVKEVGLPGTLLVAGLVNVVVAAAVFLMTRAHERLNEEVVGDGLQVVGGTASPTTHHLPSTTSRALLWVAFGTAIASFIYEIAWIRMLSLVLGSATHSFELMLSAFILGLALGALWIRSRADRIDDPIQFLGGIQWVMGTLAVATLPFYMESFDWMATLLGTVASNENGYRLFTGFRYLVSLLIMLPATFCAGMTLPLITRILMKEGGGERAIGTVYAVNTLGSIIGVILAGLILMPLLGLKRLLVLGALIDIALGIWLVVRSLRATAAATPEPPPGGWKVGRLRRELGSPLLLPLVGTAAFLIAITAVTRFDLVTLTSGVYRHGVVDRALGNTFPFYKDGRTASVSVERGAGGFLTLSTNGKPDASLDGSWLDTVQPPPASVQLTRDLATQVLLPVITLAHNPRAQQVAVIGQGSGMTSHFLLGSPHAKQVVTIEIEPEMVEGSKLFRPVNRRVFEDPRSLFVIDDAKSYFAASGRRFDLILSEPSNPWVSGVSGLFTQEFYTRVKRQLAPRGVFGQWLHLYELNDGLVHSVLAAIDTVFPAYEVFYTSNADILVVASNARLPEPDWGVISYAGIANDLRRVVRFTPEWFEVLRVGGRDVLHPMLLAHGEPNSDFFPTLDLNAERMRFLHENASGYTDLGEGRFDLVAALSGRRLGFPGELNSPTPEIGRSTSLAMAAKLHFMRTKPDSQIRALSSDDAMREAWYRTSQLERLARSATPPADWHAWVDEVVAVDAALHSGTAGVVDTAFFADLRAYVARANAPQEARAAVSFLHGIGAWDWPEAAGSARLLMASAESTPWLPHTLLRNGAASAFIMTRDTAAAKQVLRDFAKKTDDDRFRERIIGAYLIALDPKMRQQMGWEPHPTPSP